MSDHEPKIGDYVRWKVPGPLVLRIQRIVHHDWKSRTWYVLAGGVGMHIRYAPLDGFLWERIA